MLCQTTNVLSEPGIVVLDTPSSVTPAQINFHGLQPPGWAASSLPKIFATNREIYQSQSVQERREGGDRNNLADLRSRAIEVSEAKWERRTGLLPGKSKLTVIVPIQNEQPFLQSSLSALMTSEIPTSVYADILFVTNACTDASPQIIDSFLKDLGLCSQFAASDSVHVLDAGIRRQMPVIEPSSSHFK